MDADRLSKAKSHLTPALVVHTDLLVRRAEGATVEDASGRRYLDFTSGLATTNTGHNHPRVVEAVRRQAERLLHGGCIFYHEPLLELCEALARITPPGIDRFFFSNSGAEAVEGAIKLSRFHTGRQGVLAFAPSFHGRTLGALSLTASTARYRRGYSPLLPGVHHGAYPYCYRCPLGQVPASCGQACREHLDWLFRHVVTPEELACVVVEPVLGEGGYAVPPPGFLRHLRELCDRWGILLVCDEVQSGMGRTGRWLACEHSGVVPDVVTLAKGIASGLPLSAVAARREIMDRWPPGAHGTTFGGNPLSCAAAVATIEAIEQDGLLENATSLGQRALARLAEMQRRHPCVGDVRGVGLMIGVELASLGKEPFPEGVRRVQAHALEKGLLLLECGRDKSVLRLAPPLVLRPEEFDRGLDILEEGLGGLGTEAL
ncbi:MAG: aspartate aminotransferase family protein [Deferrisomatales bacterium]|nr:aspartate aminotransferase family protein [Deferrisomatales bacterium]